MNPSVFNSQRLTRFVMESLQERGWALVPAPHGGITGLRKLSEQLSLEVLPSIGRQVYQAPFPGGTLHHAPCGQKEVLGHSERAYRPILPMPDLCIFAALRSIPVHLGGQLTLVDGESMLWHLPSSLEMRLRREGVVYEMEWGKERWQSEFGLDHRDDLEMLLSTCPQLSYQWKGEILSLLWRQSPLRRSWSSGREAFANGMLAHLASLPAGVDNAGQIYCHASNGISWGGGGPFADRELVEIIKAHQRCMHILTLAPKEMVVIDNTRVMHGRKASAVAVGDELVCRFGRLTKPAPAERSRWC
ncbi:TauD/TfdA family dioxygenase [Synechococcus sp. CBW1002]|uniref:TauD/TfdA family dioxygenase n=1 Tax=Synechococcus sp. CBW1002 TaxID=1353134 RepID=UPI001E62CDB2|nr:TauD/TfdA family dioxygenase [Synechococcus sp. CBW1002]